MTAEVLVHVADAYEQLLRVGLHGSKFSSLPDMDMDTKQRPVP